MSEFPGLTNANSAVTLPLSTLPPISERPTVVDTDAPPEPLTPYSVGDLVDDRYRVLSVHGGPGVSGMGVVYIVELEGQRFAAKTFQHQFSRNLSLIARFLREARTWILTGFHPNVVRAYYIDIINAAPYLFMEYVPTSSDGTVSLADRLKAGALSLPVAVDLALQCCDGMIHASTAVPGLVHRDLKPENLLIAPDGTLKITDFGLVRCNLAERPIPPGDDFFTTRDADLTLIGSAFGTPAYMAPEQFVEASTVSQVADVYAFGCCFYEAVSGHRLFTIRAETPIEHLLAMRRVHQTEPPVPLLDRIPDCPQELDRVIMKCLEKDPKQRWQSFDEVRERLFFVYERVLAQTYGPRAIPCPTPAQVADQGKSLTLLDGFHRAVRLRRLRESQDIRPYTFHLALASYFHCAEEYEEERRQLEKALRVAGSGEGHEAVRRIGELLVNLGNLDRAEHLIEVFLSTHPGDIDQCLEPYVYLRVAQGDFATADKVLEPFGSSRRVDSLRAHLYRAAHRCADLAALLTRQLEEVVRDIRSDIENIDPGDRVGWEFDGDAHVLCRTLKVLAPDVHLDLFDKVEHVIWPDLDAYPDFSARMAWLSDAVGGLADGHAALPSDQQNKYAELAKLLGYPTRLSRHLTRDEVWFWMSDPGDDSGD